MTKRDPLEGAQPPVAPAPLSFDQQVRRRQKGRAIVMGLGLAAFVILLYAITIARIGAQ